MTTGAVIVKGIVHGKTIELDRDSGMPEGQVVSVVLRPALPPGEGLRRAFGAWADDTKGLDQFTQDVYRDRAGDRPEPTP